MRHFFAVSDVFRKNGNMLNDITCFMKSLSIFHALLSIYLLYNK